MTCRFDEYLPFAAQALDEAGFVDPDDGTIPHWREGEPVPAWTAPEEAAHALLEAVGPLIRRQVAEEVAGKLDGLAADPHGSNGEQASWAFSMAAGIAREIGGTT